jgi:hypothetical protein
VCEAGRSLASRADIKNECSYTFSPPCNFSPSIIWWKCQKLSRIETGISYFVWKKMLFITSHWEHKCGQKSMYFYMLCIHKQNNVGNTADYSFSRALQIPTPCKSLSVYWSYTCYFSILKLIYADCCVSVCLILPHFILFEVMTRIKFATVNYWKIWSDLWRLCSILVTRQCRIQVLPVPSNLQIMPVECR